MGLVMSVMVDKVEQLDMLMTRVCCYTVKYDNNKKEKCLVLHKLAWPRMWFVGVQDHLDLSTANVKRQAASDCLGASGRLTVWSSRETQDRSQRKKESLLSGQLSSYTVSLLLLCCCGWCTLQDVSSNAFSNILSHSRYAGFSMWYNKHNKVSAHCDC